MIVGKLNKRVVIKYPAMASDGQGGRATTWETKYTVWANINVPKASVQSVQGAVASALTYEITIREVSDNLVGCKVFYGNREFNVIHCYSNNFNGTVLQCVEVIKR